MKKVNVLKKKKVINDLLDEKFDRLDKIVGGLAPGGCTDSNDCSGVVA